MATPLERLVAQRIANRGPMPFSRFVDLALYDQQSGFYATSGRAGRGGGDFITSVEVGPLFGAVVGRWLDSVWIEAGSPEDFRIAEAGAGVGTLLRTVARAAPRCCRSLVWTLVERSASLRVEHQRLETSASVFPVRWRSSADLPSAKQHVVLANELLDNLGFDIAQRVQGGWAPVMVGLTDAVVNAVGTQRGKMLKLVTADSDPALNWLAGLVPDAELGARVPVMTCARRWVLAAQRLAPRVLLFDYGAATCELAARPAMGWLRTYGRHARGQDPFSDLGNRDITVDVAFDQLPYQYRIKTQRQWLHDNGIEDQLATARDVWERRGPIGDLEAIGARSAVIEADALCDPDGLGSFKVLEWIGQR